MHIVFYPGWSESSAQYSTLKSALETYGHTVFVGDHSHVGQSKFTFFIDEKTVVAQAMLDNVPKDEPCILVGHSVGSIEALLISGKPNVRAVVLFSPVGITERGGLLRVFGGFACKVIFDLFRSITFQISAIKFIRESTNGLLLFLREPVHSIREGVFASKGHHLITEKPLYIVKPSWDPILPKNRMKKAYPDATILRMNGSHDQVVYDQAEAARIVDSVIGVLS